MIVVWRAAARKDRRALFERTLIHNPTAAVRFDDLIRERVERLMAFPAMYAVGRAPGTRQIVLDEEHILVYRIKPRREIIEIVRIVGARQAFPGRRA
ncbi:Plasmid stabilization system protein [compost metagenome]|uniref:Type II toxin-antitoxin system RelE/ParE family toxin n=1 Tax=Cupriavidus campinensis TaxID=151783 RepID=A0ABY3EKN2_9BURK|nr:type II toxin-antitoxin system RelE/ParE family toxin [Cupriavidus campinensis]CAG2143388.1 hypothetical protein LMG19282_02388 [Cupriavidus campinensis]